MQGFSAEEELWAISGGFRTSAFVGKDPETGQVDGEVGSDTARNPEEGGLRKCTEEQSTQKCEGDPYSQFPDSGPVCQPENETGQPQAEVGLYQRPEEQLFRDGGDQCDKKDLLHCPALKLCLQQRTHVANDGDCLSGQPLQYLKCTSCEYSQKQRLKEIGK